MANYGFETRVERFAPLDGTDPSPSPLAEDLVASRGWTCAGPRQADAPLSPRERQILTLVHGGKTRKEVAYDLGVTHSTVRVLYSRAMKKLGGRWQPVR